MIDVAKRFVFHLVTLVWIALSASLGVAQSTGTLEVTITGLPQGTDAKVTLSSALLSKPIAITRSGRLSQLRPGTYTLEAERVTISNTNYTPQYLRQSVEIKPNATSRITVAYTPPAGSLLLTVNGLPSGTAARIVLSGEFLDSPLAIDKSSRISDLIPGTYTLSVSSVSSGGLTYTPALARQTVVIRSREETTATITYKAPPGSLRLEIKGLPSGQARVTLSGPNFNQTLSSSTTLEDLEAGTYTLTAPSVTFAGITYSAQPAQQTVTVEAGQLAQAEVVYQAPPGSLRVNITGIFGDTRARVTLSGNGVNLAIERSSVIRDLAPGSYTLTAEPLEVSGVVYQVAPLRQQIEIVTQTETTAIVGYSPPPGSLRLQVEGLPSGITSKLVLRGPNNYAREFNLAASTTLSSLTPGEYTLSASEALANSDPYDPSPDNQILQVLPARTLVAKVTYSMSQGRLVLVPQGTPTGLPAQVTLTGTPQPTPFALTSEKSLDLPKGSYILTSPLLYYQGKAYGPLKETQTVQVAPRKETRVLVAYQELPSVDLTLEPEGLARGGSVEVVITGPNNIRIELTLTGPETLLDLLPGAYRLTTPSNSNFYLTFDLISGKTNLVKVGLKAPSPVGAELRATLQGHTSFVYSVAFSPDGKTLASGSGDRTIKLWDMASGRNTTTLQGHTSDVYSVAFSPDGKTLASGSWDNTIKLWDVASGRNTATLQGHSDQGHSDWIFSVAFSTDGKTLASGSGDRTIKLWDVASGRNTLTLQGHTNYVFSVAFSTDGKTLASGSGDRTIKLWDVASGRNTITLQGHLDYVRSIDFSTDGKTLASGSDDNTIKLWDVASGRNTLTLQGHTNYVFSVAFSTDGKTLASGSGDRTIKLWDVASGRNTITLQGYLDYVRSIDFSTDGKTLASGSDDNTIKLWNLLYR